MVVLIKLRQKSGGRILVNPAFIIKVSDYTSTYDRCTHVDLANNLILSVAESPEEITTLIRNAQMDFEHDRAASAA